MIKTVSKPYWDERKRRWSIVVQHEEGGETFVDVLRFHREEQAINRYNSMIGKVKV
jgi:hypothetical protein